MIRDFRYGYAAFALFLSAVLGGAVYCAVLEEADFSAVGEYFSDYFSGAANREVVFEKALLNNFIFGICVTFGGLCRLGTFFSAVAVCKEGFVAGFCGAGLSRALGKNGALLGTVSKLNLLLFLPIMALAVEKSIKMGKNFKNESKKNKIFFVFFQIFLITIFCGCAFLEAYVNTTFMGKVAGKIIK